VRNQTAKAKAKPQTKPRAKLAAKGPNRATKVTKPAPAAKPAKPAKTAQPAAQVPPAAPQPTPDPRRDAMPTSKAPTAAQLDRRAAREAKERAAKIETFEKALLKNADRRCADLTGRAAGPGWVLTATDGHRALLRPGVATNDGSVPPDFRKVAAIAIEFTQDVVASLRRMVAASSKALEFKTTLVLEDITHESTRGVLKLSVKNPSDGVEEATETVEITGQGLRPFSGAVNGNYLLQVGGLYPSTLHVSSAQRDAILFQVVAPEARILIIGFGKNTAFPAGEAPARDVEAPTTAAIATTPAAAPTTPAAIASPKTPRVRTAAPAGDLTVCECCGQPSRARTATTGKTRFSHKCPHGNPCPTGVAKKTIAACPICRDRAAQVPAETAVSA